MAYTTINKSGDYFNTKLWSGNGSSQALTGVGHQTDMVWIKSRTDTRKHNLYDVVRGVQKRIVSNDSVVEDTVPGVTAFGADGFTVGSETDTNGSSRNFVGWSWKAGAGQGSSNTDGSINTTYTSVNTTAGFSISQYTGTGSNATVGHGLGVIPEMIIIKEITGSGRNWRVYHKKLGNNYVMYLNTDSDRVSDATAFNSTSPTSSVFSLGTSGGTNDNGNNYIAYCFAPKTGYSKFGQYKSTGYSDGPFCYTGFKPKYILIKNYSNSAEWEIYDAARVGYNDANYHLNAEDTSAEATLSGRLDLLSNGFKIRVTNSGPLNSGTAGQTYFYMAFAEAPLVGSNNIPCTAR